MNKLKTLLALCIIFAACRAGDTTSEKARPIAGNDKPTRESASLVVIGNGAPELRSPSVHVAQQDAQNAAEKDVQLRMKNFVKQLRFSQGVTVADKLSQDQALEKRIDKLIAEHKTIDKLYFSDGSMDLIASLSLPALLSAITGDPESKESLPPATLIIDARKVAGYAPSLVPAIKNSEGKPLFTSKHPVISFATSIDAARTLAKGAAIITLSENALSDNELVLSSGDAEKVSKAGASALVIVSPKR
jgi:hypothetical protein